MKKLTLILLSFVILFEMVTMQAQAATPSLRVMLHNKQLTYVHQQPRLEHGTTLIPVRPFLERLGYELRWNAETSTLHASKDMLSFKLKTNYVIAHANGDDYRLPVAPEIIEGTLYAPLRFLAKHAGYSVVWSAANRTIFLEQQKKKGFFWKVEKGDSQLYLLGSIHGGSEGIYPMPPQVNAAYASSDHLVVEVNMAAPLDERQMIEFQKKYMVYDDGTTLTDHIEAETYSQLKEILKNNGYPESAYDPFKAWFAYLSLVNLKSALEGYEGGLGIDLYFLQKAMATGKSVLELESHELQYSMLNGWSGELAASLLKRTVYTFDSSAESTKSMVDLYLGSIETLMQIWMAGDDVMLTEMTNAMKEIPEYYNAVIGERNRRMIKKIEGYLGDESKQTYFVVAGAGHMLGEDGIVTKLKEKGYTVTRL